MARTHATPDLRPVNVVRPTFFERRPRLQGALAVLVAALSFTVANLMTGTVAHAGMPIITILLWIGVVRFLAGGLVVMVCREWREAFLCRSKSWSFVRLVGVRQLVGCLSSICTVLTISMVSLGEATSLILTAPIWAALFASVLLGEPLRCADIAAAIGACAGVALIAIPTQNCDRAAAHVASRDARQHIGGTICGIGAALTVSLLYVVIRLIGTRQPAIVGTTQYGFFLVVMSFPLVVTSRAPLVPDGISAHLWFALVCGSSLSLFANVAISWALQRLEAGRVTLLLTLEIAFAFILQIITQNVEPPPASCLGAVLVVCCTAGVSAFNMLCPRSHSTDSGNQNAPGEQPNLSFQAAHAEGYDLTALYGASEFAPAAPVDARI